MADDLRPGDAQRKFYKVTFVRHGSQEEVTLGCKADAELFARWLDYAGAGIGVEIAEEEG